MLAHPELPEDLLEAAAQRLLALPLAERTRVVDELVREHPQHRVPLRRLAGDLAGTERMLGTGFAAHAESTSAIGPYRVLGVIGEGAFGVVYLCAQETPVRRDVAVKVLRPGAGDRHTLARFEAERHLLATLSHPAIAQVFDAGALPDGRPYFVMEYVRGLPITSHCDKHRLGVDARLALFVRLCQGAHHAHAKGIVHRDFKPANVLVFEQDGQPQPKIIDFGIAKAVHPTDAGIHPRTETGRVIGTPGYMSPEQFAGANGTLDARADVFSLGVMLYELLTGELPWGRRLETTASDPPRPSARVATDATGDVARQRSIQPRKLVSRLRGDLDWIVLKALARERERRYASAQDLAADVVRHLRGEPVLAGPPTVGYRLRKLTRRYRAALLATGVALLAIALGVWSSLSSRAEARMRGAEAIAAAGRLLERARDDRVVDAPQSEGLRQALLQDALGFYDRFLRERPTEPKLREGRARALETLSQVHWLVGEYAQAAAVAREAAAEAEALLAAAPGNVIYRGILGSALRKLGRALSSGGQAEAARAAFDRSVRELERCDAEVPGKYAELLGAVLLEWGSALTAGEWDARAGALRRAVTIHEGILRDRPSVEARLCLLIAITALGGVLTEGSELQEAARVFARADDLLASTPEASPAYVCTVLGGGAALAARRGDHAAAIERLTAAIAAARRWSAQEPTWPQPWVELRSLHDQLAAQHRALGDHATATAVSRAAIAVGEARAQKFPHDPLAHSQLGDQLSSFAGEILALGRRDVLGEAEAFARRAVQMLDTVPDSVDLRVRERARWSFRCQLSLVLDARGSEDARAQWEATSQAMDAWHERFGVAVEDATLFVEGTLRLARLRLAACLDDRTAGLLDRVEAVIHQHAAAIDRLPLHAAEMHRLRALLAVRRGDDALVAAECGRARSAADGWPGVLAAADATRAAWQAARPASVPDPGRAASHRDQAIELHRAAMVGLREAVAASPGDLRIELAQGQASVRLAELLLDRGEGDAAQKLLAEALPALAALRDQAHANCWDEALYVAGQAMAAR